MPSLFWTASMSTCFAYDGLSRRRTCSGHLETACRHRSNSARDGCVVATNSAMLASISAETGLIFNSSTVSNPITGASNEMIATEYRAVKY